MFILGLGYNYVHLNHRYRLMKLKKEKNMLLFKALSKINRRTLQLRKYLKYSSLFINQSNRSL